MRLALAVLLALALAACDSQSPGSTCSGTADCPPPEAPDVAAGVDLARLFAPPTAAERDSVAARLGRTARTVSPRIASVRATALRTDADGTRYTLLSALAEDQTEVLHAVARTPAASVGAGAPLPVLLLLPDGDGQAAEARFLTGETAGGLDRTTVQVVVAFRGAALTTRSAGEAGPASVVWSSDVTAIPYRGDAVDVLDLAARLDAVPRAAAARLGATGIGRGAAVALLAAERAPGRFRGIASLSAPTSLFDPTFRTTVRQALTTGTTASRLPAVEALVAPARALARGEITLAEARLRLLEMSAIALADRLPALRAFHASPDDVVPFAHLERLEQEGGGTTAAPRRFDPVREVPHDALLDDTTLRGLLADFFDATL